MVTTGGTVMHKTLKIFVALVCTYGAVVSAQNPTISPAAEASSSADANALIQLRNLEKEIALNRSRLQNRPSEFILFARGQGIWQPGRRFKTSEKWLGLLCDAGQCQLRPAKVVVTPKSVQGHYDDKPTAGQLLQFNISQGATKNVVAWFALNPRSPWLAAGNVNAYVAKFNKGKDYSTVISLPNGEMRLMPLLLSAKQWSAAAGIGDSLRPPALLLQLRDVSKRQLLPTTLASCTGHLDAGYFIWAGDLDGDGKPDYLIEFDNAYGSAQLFLSSAAASGQLVGLAGQFDNTEGPVECDGNELSER
jgi:hypothetical protein